jgi:hypothetical protein
MPVLSNAKHEAMAQALAKGMSATAAYKEAGYRGDRTAASRMSTNVNIRARVKELQADIAAQVVAQVSFDAVELFTRLEEDIQDAKKAGNHTAAIKGREIMIEAFGYKDHPTLTHEHIHRRTVNVNGQGTQGSGAGDPQPSGTLRNSIAQFRKELEKARAARQN